MNWSDNIRDRIKKLRLAKHMTQEELANILHVTPQAVSRWEPHVSYPDTAMLPAISKALAVSVDGLLGCNAESGGAYKENIQELEPDTILNQSQIDSMWDAIPIPVCGSKNVLVIDDSEFMRKMLKDILGGEGPRSILLLSQLLLCMCKKSSRAVIKHMVLLYTWKC